MNHISNRSILALIAITLIISTVSTFISISKLDGLQNRYNVLTGAVTSSSSSGQTNITLAATTSITLGMELINFGSGRVNASCDYCNIDTDLHTATSYYSNGSIILQDTHCCIGFNTSGNSNVDGFTIENTGNVNVSVGYTCSGNCTHTLFVGGTLGSPMGGIELRIYPGMNGATSELGGFDTQQSCAGGGTLYRDSSWNATNDSSYTNPSNFSYTGGTQPIGSANGAPRDFVLSSRGHWLCGNNTNYPLMPDNTKDAANLAINLTIPRNAPGTGIMSSFSLTFNATSAG